MGTLIRFLLVAWAAVGLWAQSANQPLTNAEIEKMLTSGLPESTILLKIEDAVDRGIVNLDASANALIALKEKGATEGVLNQVLWAEPFKADWEEQMAEVQQKQAEEQAAPGLPDAPGVYFRRSSEWVPMQSFLLWLPMYAGAAWLHRAHEYSVPVGIGNSELQIAETQPRFYVRMPASGESWQIVRATPLKDQRRLRLASVTGFGPSESITPAQTGDIHDVSMTRVAGSIFALRPDATLAPGEYILCTAVQGGPGLKLCYNFRIQQ